MDQAITELVEKLSQAVRLLRVIQQLRHGTLDWPVILSRQGDTAAEVRRFHIEPEPQRIDQPVDLALAALPDEGHDDLQQGGGA